MMKRLPIIEGTDATLGTMANALRMSSEKGGLNLEELLPILFGYHETQRCVRKELVGKIKPVLHEGRSSYWYRIECRRGAKSVIMQSPGAGLFSV
jgi:hypothetical protein